MRKQYNHLSIEERAVIMTELERKSSIRKISTLLACSPSTISREIKRFPDPSNYHVRTASQAANAPSDLFVLESLLQRRFCGK